MDLALALDKKGHRGEFQPRRMGGICVVIWAGPFSWGEQLQITEGYSINDFNYRRIATRNRDSHGQMMIHTRYSKHLLRSIIRTFF